VIRASTVSTVELALAVARAPCLEVWLCDELRFELDGVRIDGLVRRRQSLELLGLLVLERGRWLRREELIEALWPESSRGSKDGSLRVLLSDLRGAIGDGMLRTRPGVRLELPDGAFVDVEQAARLLDQAHAAVRRGAFAEAGDDASCVLTLTRCALLPFAAGDWIERHRREQEELSLGALECLAEASVRGGGAVERGIWAARQLVARAPFRERGHELLMRALAAEGNAAEALMVYEGLRSLLRDDLGAVPSGRIADLHRRLLLVPALDVA
jgi:SARP family transcriptional regulator, regulator of embCAB operon